MSAFPSTQLYGPYHHGGRSYYQWMARGRALVEDLLPCSRAELTGELDGHAAERFDDDARRATPTFIARASADAASTR